MIGKKELEAKMKERGYIVYAYMGTTKVQFVSKHMYDIDRDPEVPVINVLVDLQNESFKLSYSVPFSVTQLTCGECSPIMDDNHFNKMTQKFIEQATVLEKTFRR